MRGCQGLQAGFHASIERFPGRIGVLGFRPTTGACAMGGVAGSCLSSFEKAARRAFGVLGGTFYRLGCAKDVIFSTVVKRRPFHFASRRRYCVEVVGGSDTLALFHVSCTPAGGD